MAMAAPAFFQRLRGVTQGEGLDSDLQAALVEQLGNPRQLATIPRVAKFTGVTP